MKRIFPLLVVLTFSVLLSCGSVPSPDSVSPEERTETTDQSVPAEEGGASSPLAGEDDDAEAPVPVPEVSAPGGDESVLPLPEPESGTPDTALPPEAPPEERSELPEPRPPLFSFPQPEPPPFRMTPTPPLPLPPQNQNRRETPRENPPAPPPPADPSPAPEEIPPPRTAPRKNPPVPPPSADPSPVPEEIPPPQTAPREETPRQEQTQPPAPREAPVPPSPPAFVRPAEPEIPPPAREPVPVPVNPLPELPARAVPETAGEEVVFSRIVRVTVGQIVEIPFRGTGWVYLGELGNRRGISYDSRRLDINSSAGVTEGQSFIFRAEAAGTYALKFYKQDFIRDYIINDYVQVIVGDDPEYPGSGRAGFPVDRGRVIAEPRWPPADGVRNAPVETGLPETEPPPAAAREANPPASANQAENTPAPEAVPAAEIPQSPPQAGGGNETPPPAAPAAPPPAEVPLPRQTSADDGIIPVAPPQAVTPGPSPSISFSPDDPLSEYVRRAKEEFDAGRVESALVVLDAMRQRFPAGSDEAWWLYGQLLEANSSGRDIRLALEYYRRLVREYPQSPRAGDALRRIAYLERHYFNIR